MQITGAKSLRNNSANKFWCRRWIPLSFNALYAQRHNEKWPWFIVCRENLHRKPFQRESTEKSFLFFSFFFFLVFLSREQDNAYRRCRRRGCRDFAVCCDYDAVANESAADAVCSYVRSQHVTGGPFAGTVYYTLFLERQTECGHKSTNVNINPVGFRNCGR